MAKRTAYTSALILGGILAAAPAAAVRDFTANGLTGVAGNSITLHVSAHALDNELPGGFPSSHAGKAVSTVREPAGWLLMLAGLGFLGAMNRRSDPHPSSDELGL